MRDVTGSEPQRNSSFSPKIISKDQKHPQEKSFYYSMKFTLRKYLPLIREVIVIEIIIMTESMLYVRRSTKCSTYIHFSNEKIEA